jgi:hypothetical protein
MGGWNEIRSNLGAFSVSRSTPAPNALGASPFRTDGDLEGPKTGARDKIGLGLDLRRGGGPRGDEFRIPSLLRPEACRTYVLLSSDTAGRLSGYSISAWTCHVHFTIP